MNPWLILAAVAALALSNAWTWTRAIAAADTRWTARLQTERAEAEAAARATEHRTQEAADAIAKQHTQQVAAIRRTLDIALDSLRHRPERPAAMPDTTRSGCEGATGAELSRPDAEFLSREAARADDQRAGLAACYDHVDRAVR